MAPISSTSWRCVPFVSAWRYLGFDTDGNAETFRSFTLLTPAVPALDIPFRDSRTHTGDQQDDDSTPCGITGILAGDSSATFTSVLDETTKISDQSERDSSCHSEHGNNLSSDDAFGPFVTADSILGRPCGILAGKKSINPKNERTCKVSYGKRAIDGQGVKHDDDDSDGGIVRVDDETDGPPGPPSKGSHSVLGHGNSDKGPPKPTPSPKPGLSPSDIDGVLSKLHGVLPGEHNSPPTTSPAQIITSTNVNATSAESTIVSGNSTIITPIPIGTATDAIISAPGLSPTLSTSTLFPSFPAQNDTSRKTNVPAMAGGAIGALILIVLVVIGTIFFRRKRALTETRSHTHVLDDGNPSSQVHGPDADTSSTATIPAHRYSNPPSIISSIPPTYEAALLSDDHILLPSQASHRATLVSTSGVADAKIDFGRFFAAHPSVFGQMDRSVLDAIVESGYIPYMDPDMVELESWEKAGIRAFVVDALRDLYRERHQF